MEDIIEGYYKKLEREEKRLLFQAKITRKAAYISILPHVKSLPEKQFNSTFWPIDEETDKDKYSPDRIKDIQEKIRKYQKKLGEDRRKAK